MIAELVGDDPVDLLGHRAVKAAQPGLDVRERNPELHRDQHDGQRGVHIAGHDHEVGALGLEHRLDALHHACGLHGMGARTDTENMIGNRKFELLDESVGHRPVVVLAGVDDHMPRPG